MWYVIQVVTGKEEETKNVIDKELSRQFFVRLFLYKTRTGMETRWAVYCSSGNDVPGVSLHQY